MTIGSILYTLLISPLRLIFEVVFAYANSVLDHPGLSIIVLSLAINFLVLPLYRRSDAMQEEERDIQAKLKDGVAHIRKTFKGDERMMLLQTYYRQNNYKPTYVLRGAMSLFLEIPFFIAAYSFLSNLTILTGVSLGPIRNLAQPDGLVVMFGLSVNLLPIIMTAVNCVSTIIFTKGYPLKTKIQLYAMALFFLVFLYNSPSGLVFYWTLNNLFSLVKTIFYKLKNPRKVLVILAAVCGVALAVVGAVYYAAHLPVFIVLALVLELPLVVCVVKRVGKLPREREKSGREPNGKLFWTAAAFLAVLSGALIPSAVIKASPLEFVSSLLFYNPLWYVVSALCMSVGFFLIWFGVFYWLAAPKGKVWFERILFVLGGVAIVNYMFFGRDLGILNASLKFEGGMSFETLEVLLNAAVVLAVAVALYLLCRRWQNASATAAMICALAMVGMAGLNVFSVSGTVRDYLKTATLRTTGDENKITLSRDGQNVIVLMLDRAVASAVPYIMNERPEIAEQFEGFTFYDNVASHGLYTNFASPSLYGGYEYTPYEINKRDGESLASKQNEALKVMPVMFLQEGYDVTVYDPTYAGYQWIPDLSIFNDYPEIKTGITMGSFNKAYETMAKVERQTRNRSIFCYSIMKMAPVCLQSTLYDQGNYRHLMERSEVVNAMDSTFESYATASIQVEDSNYTAHGIYSYFLDSYTVLTHLDEMTEVTDGGNTFLMMSNDTAHELMLLQEPDYVPAYMVDNTAYEEANVDRFTLDGKTLVMDELRSYEHYQVNMAAFMKLGEWFDYLRQIGVYDNTRIILVSDHSDSHAGYVEEEMLQIEGQEETFELTGFYPLLMVKDFNSNGEMEIDSSFMSNADVPTLATEGLIDEPTNPFTGKAINNDAKHDGKLYLFAGGEWDTKLNNGNMFNPDDWYSVHDSIWEAENWAYEGFGNFPEDADN